MMSGSFTAQATIEFQEKEIESLQDNLEKARLDMLDMEATRVDDEQKCLDAIADLGSKINNVFAIRKDHLKERLETKAKAQEQLPYFENNSPGGHP